MEKRTNKKVKNLNRKRDQHTIVLEQINSKMGLLVENYQELKVGQDCLREDVSILASKVEGLDARLYVVEKKVDDLETRFNGLEEKVDIGFEKSFEYMSRIEEELTGKLCSKVDRTEHDLLKERVSRLETVRS